MDDSDKYPSKQCSRNEIIIFEIEWLLNANIFKAKIFN
jgi:hypothetical protein